MRLVEIDVIKQQQLRSAVDLATKYRCPSIVVMPDYVKEAMVMRGMARGNFRIIATIDWPKGEKFNTDKFMGLQRDALEADGFELLLTATNQNETLKEVKYLSKFARQYLNPLFEMRAVLGCYATGRTDDHLVHMCKALIQVPNITMIRTTHLTKINAAHGNADAQNDLISKIKGICTRKVKVSGNITFKNRMGIKAERFACTPDQAKALQKELADEGLKSLRNTVHIKEQYQIKAPDADKFSTIKELCDGNITTESEDTLMISTGDMPAEILNKIKSTGAKVKSLESSPQEA